MKNRNIISPWKFQLTYHTRVLNPMKNFPSWHAFWFAPGVVSCLLLRVVFPFCSLSWFFLSCCGYLHLEEGKAPGTSKSPVAQSPVPSGRPTGTSQGLQGKHKSGIKLEGLEATFSDTRRSRSVYLADGGKGGWRGLCSAGSTGWNDNQIKDNQLRCRDH